MSLVSRGSADAWPASQLAVAPWQEQIFFRSRNSPSHLKIPCLSHSHRCPSAVLRPTASPPPAAARGRRRRGTGGGSAAAAAAAGPGPADPGVPVPGSLASGGPAGPRTRLREPGDRAWGLLARHGRSRCRRRVSPGRGCPLYAGVPSPRGSSGAARCRPEPSRGRPPPALGWGLLPRVTRGRPLLPAGFPGRGAAGAAVAALPALPAPAAAGQRFAFVPPPRCGIPGGGPPGDFPGADSPATPLGDQLGLWGGGSPAAPRFHHGRDRPQLDRASGPRSWLPAASPGREGGPGRAGGSPGAGGDPSCPRAPSSRLLASFSPALSRSSCRQDKPLRPGAGSSNRCVWELLLGGTRCPPGFSPSALPGVTLAGRARGPEPAASGAATVGPCAKPCFY